MSGFVRRHGLLQGQGLDLGPYSTRTRPASARWSACSPIGPPTGPDKDWIVFDSRDRLTFGGAWAEACRAGHAFDRDLSPGAHVGLLMRNQPEFLISFYGTLVRGGMAVPLNADSRGPLLHAVIEHSDIEAIVVRDELVERLTTLTDLGHVRLVIAVGDGPAPDEIHGVRVVRFADWLAGLPTEHAWPFPRDDEHAAIMYTSGTTARPKGAVYTHQYLYLYASLGCDSQERTEDDVLTAPLPLYHAAALHVIANACAARRVHRASEVAVLRLAVLAAVRRRRRHLGRPARADVDDDPEDDAGPGARAPGQAHLLPAAAARPRGVRAPLRSGADPLVGLRDDGDLPDAARSRPSCTTARCRWTRSAGPSRWVDYGVVDEHDRLLRAERGGRARLSPAASRTRW